MERSSSSFAARAGRAGVTIDQFDTETVRSAQAYLNTPADRRTLTPPCFEAWNCDHWINGVTFTDIAWSAGVPVGRVRQRHLRAMRELRRIYSQLGDD